ncbi:porin [Paraburkholderia sp. Cy-641]|uniref:porin n=1 Tax=Paraburkholderia sp. Cy-641 TaxID=2608337 RepID=UPI0014221D30|nr:porin [Paraburkholderia sp. Cy-641]NIF80043.1 porin [Paraburkholderia sp. Cy-641]
MKKIMFGTALACLLSQHAYAQSTVTLYGLIETGIDYVNNSGGKSLVAMRDGVSTGISGSRWGLIGSEDLGGGLKTIFKLESGFNVTNGTLGQGGLAFGRTAYVGITSNRFGTVTLGRQYDSIVDYLQFAGDGNQWGGMATHGSGDMDNIGNTVRTNNSIKYASGDVYGFRFGGVYGFSSPTAYDQVGTTGVLSAGVNYIYGPLKLGVAYFHAKDPADQFADGHYVANTTGSAIGATGPWSYVGHPKDVQTYGAGATYQVGNGVIGVLYTRILFSQANGTKSDVSFEFYNVSYTYFVRPALKLGAGYLYTIGHVDYSGAVPKYHRVIVGADYSLSKRTEVYGVVALQLASGDAKGADLYQGVVGNMSTTNRQLAARVAIIHRF